MILLITKKQQKILIFFEIMSDSLASLHVPSLHKRIHLPLFWVILPKKMKLLILIFLGIISQTCALNLTKIENVVKFVRGHRGDLLQAALSHLKLDVHQKLYEHFPHLKSKLALLRNVTHECYDQSISDDAKVDILNEPVHSVIVKFFVSIFTICIDLSEGRFSRDKNSCLWPSMWSLFQIGGQ